MGEPRKEAKTFGTDGKNIAVIVLAAGLFFLFFGANDNTPGGPDDDNDWLDFFNPPWSPG